MHKLIVFWLVILLGVGLILATGGCSQAGSTPLSTTPNPVQSYADPATIVMFQGLSENDLSKYLQYCNADMKAAVSSDVLSATSKPLTAQYGQFQSIQFLSTENQNAYVIVHYKAKFTKGDLKVRMVFDANHLIAGQWFE